MTGLLYRASFDSAKTGMMNSKENATVQLDHSYYPLQTGYRWTYRTTQGEDSELTPMEVLPPETIGGTATLPLTDLFEPARDIYNNYTITPQCLTLHGVRMGIQGSFDLEPPLDLIPFPAGNGDRFDHRGNAVSKLTGPLEEGRQMSFSVVVDGPVTVTVPAGTFENCFITILHRSVSGRRTSVRAWLASGVGMVRGESLTSDGLLKTVELVCAELGGVVVGDVSLGCDFDFYDLQHQKIQDAVITSEPITLAELIRLLSPLNVETQQVDGFLLREITTRGSTQLVFTDARDESLPEIRIRLFRTGVEARRYRGERTQAGDMVALLIPAEGVPEEFARRRITLFRKVVALLRYNYAQSEKPVPES